VHSDYHVVLQEIIDFPTPYRNREVVINQLGVMLPDDSYLVLRCDCENSDELTTLTPKAHLASYKLGGFFVSRANNIKDPNNPTKMISGSSIVAWDAVDIKGTVNQVSPPVE
jgi:hypothetical protein